MATADELRMENEQLRQLVQQLQAEVERLRAQLEASQRAGKRQAAPFSKGAPQPHPKTPGRKAGDAHGPHAHRTVPAHIDEILDVPLPAACPGCGGSLAETHVDHQYQTEIPRRPIVRQFDVHCGSCRACGQTCRGRHPLQTSDATGAAASQLGPDAQAAIVWLNKDAGLSHGKIARALDTLFGLRVTRGACAQVVLRAGQKLQPTYQAIRTRLRESKHITPDETGWRRGGQPVWLHTAVGDGVTWYAVHPQRGAEALGEVIGFDWSGTMTHDGWAPYDRFTEAVHQQCVAHVMRRAHELEQSQVGAAAEFPRQVIGLFQEALGVRDQFLAGLIGESELEAAQAHYVAELLERTKPEPQGEANARLARHLWGHAEEWFMFLGDTTIPATNYRAEQAIRPAVVNRKVWGGNRTDAGAEAQGVISSVLRTCHQQAVSAFDFVRDTLCGATRSLFTTPTPELGR
jgi:transposase